MQNDLVAPLHRSNATLRRWHRAAGRSAEWCLRWCTPAVLVAFVAIQFSSQFWWRAIWFTLAATLALLVFSVPGAAIAATALIIRRENRWYEWFGILCGLLGGAGLIWVGCIGAWMLFKTGVLGH